MIIKTIFYLLWYFYNNCCILTMSNIKTLREEIHDLMEMNNLTSDYLDVDITDYILFKVLNQSKYWFNTLNKM